MSTVTETRTTIKARYRSRLHDADNLERTKRAMLALALAHRSDKVPAVLAGIQTKAAIAPLVHKGLKSAGYYDVIPDSEYRDKTPAGLAMQALIDRQLSDADREADRNRRAAEELARLEDEVRFLDIPGFFPTPPLVIEQMLQLAEIEDGMTVLEPSAGKGDILDAVVRKQPGCKLTHCEVVPRLQEILRRKHPEAEAHSDFLELPVGQYDRVVMNPPFEKGQWIDHIRRAYEQLAPGGRLASVIPAGGGCNGKGDAFRRWVNKTAEPSRTCSGPCGCGPWAARPGKWRSSTRRTA
jgi:hypothetical protein